MLRVASICVCVAIAVVTGGCATMTRGTTQSIAISSSPGGASVIIDGTYRGQTPLVVALPRNSDHSGVVELAGHQPVAFAITRKFTNATFGNILVGGLIGAAVDAGTGASYDLVPDSVFATLQPMRTISRASEARP